MQSSLYCSQIWVLITPGIPANEISFPRTRWNKKNAFVPLCYSEGGMKFGQELQSQLYASATEGTKMA